MAANGLGQAISLSNNGDRVVGRAKGETMLESENYIGIITRRAHHLHPSLLPTYNLMLNLTNE